MKRLIIVGSPRVEGRSGALADLLFETCIEECPEDEVFLAPVSTLDIAGCAACDFCKRKTKGQLTEEEQADEDAFEAQRAEDEAPHRCVIRDDMDDIYPLLEDADELIVVAPVFFAGPSSQLKAVLDRFQPYFWTRTRARKRPCTLHVVGEGGDPHGFDPLVGCVRSAAAVAGFRLERVLNWVGKIDESGEIVAEADEYPVDGPVVRAFAGGKFAEAGQDASSEDASGQGQELGRESAFEPEPEPEPIAENDFAAQLASQAARRKNRARLDLGENGSERQVIQLDEQGRRVDAAQHGRKRSAQKKNANAKRGTNGVNQAARSASHVQKGKGGKQGGRSTGKQGGKGSNGSRGSKQGKRRG